MKRIGKIIAAIMFGTLFFQQAAAQKQESWEEANTRATGLYRQQQFIKANRAVRHAVELARKLPESEKEKVAISLGNLSMIATHLGNFGEAETAAKEELAIREKLFGRENRDVIKAWNHLAIVYTMAQSPADAEFCLEKIISISEKVYGGTSREVLTSLQKLEKFYQISKNREKEKAVAARIEKISPATK